MDNNKVEINYIDSDLLVEYASEQLSFAPNTAATTTLAAREMLRHCGSDEENAELVANNYNDRIELLCDLVIKTGLEDSINITMQAQILKQIAEYLDANPAYARGGRRFILKRHKLIEKAYVSNFTWKGDVSSHILENLQELGNELRRKLPRKSLTTVAATLIVNSYIPEYIGWNMQQHARKNGKDIKVSINRHKTDRMAEITATLDTVSIIMTRQEELIEKYSKIDPVI